jgi:hypothetical protein
VTREAGTWWKHGVFYQIYPRSFMDANGDGVGDLEGIRRRLDHLAWLGVDALWLSPCFPSPMADFGYDVADYCDVDPLFGSLADLDQLVADAHACGLRLILDWVPNHSSDRHPWFLESRASRTSPKRDWYVWRDAKADGSPPNNWQSAFGGPAWEWDAPTQQFYLHSFLKEQPDLDWRNPEVVAAMHDVLRFWLERGIDGFRIDVIQRIAKDPELRDNPTDARTGAQHHIHDENHPDVHEALRALRKLVDSYGDRMMVGEVYLMDPAQVARYYGRGDELHLAFNFSFLRSPWAAAAFRREIERFESLVPPEGWPDWVLSNHDVSRHRTRYDHAELGDAAPPSSTTGRRSACATWRSAPSGSGIPSPARSTRDSGGTRSAPRCSGAPAPEQDSPPATPGSRSERPRRAPTSSPSAPTAARCSGSTATCSPCGAPSPLSTAAPTAASRRPRACSSTSAAPARLAPWWLSISRAPARASSSAPAPCAAACAVARERCRARPTGSSSSPARARCSCSPRVDGRGESPTLARGVTGG